MAFNYVTAQNDELDLICYRYYGYTRGTVEAVLLANRDLADRMPFIEEGVTIVLPDITAEAPSTPTAIRLWS